MQVISFVKSILLIEWMCLSIYSHMSVHMLQDITWISPSRASFIILMLSYIARPIGAYIFAKRDHYQTLKYACLLLIISCAMFAISPPAPYIFIWALVCRVMQSLAIGAGYGPSYILIYQEAIKNRDIYINYNISLVESGVFIGLLCGDAISLLSSIVYSQTGIHIFAWRFPFILTSVIAAASFWRVRNYKASHEIDSVVEIKEDIGKEDIGKEDIGKEDIGKEDIGKEDIGKEDIGKEYQQSVDGSAQSGNENQPHDISVGTQSHKPQPEVSIYMQIGKYTLICIAIGIEMCIFYFHYVYIATMSSAWYSTLQNQYAYNIFWMTHKLAFLILLPSVAMLIDIINHRWPYTKNYLSMCAACILSMCFGLCFNIWPNVWMAIISLSAFLLCYGSFISWTIERVHQSQYHVIGILFHVAAVFVGGPIPFLSTLFGANAVIFLSFASLLSFMILFVIEKKSAHME